MEQGIADLQDEESAQLRGSQTPVLRFEKLVPFAAPIGLLDETAHSDSPRWRESSPEETVLGTPGQYKPWQTTAGIPLPKIRRGLARAWRLMLALQIDEALRVVERLELQLDEVQPSNAQRLRGAMQLLRAAGLALQDSSLSVLPIAVSLLKKSGTTQHDHAALTLCRLRFGALVSLIRSVCFRGSNRGRGGRIRWQYPRCLSSLLRQRSHLIIYACPLPSGWPSVPKKVGHETPGNLDLGARKDHL